MIFKGCECLRNDFVFLSGKEKEKKGRKIPSPVSISTEVVGLGNECIERESYDGINNCNLLFTGFNSYSTFVWILLCTRSLDNAIKIPPFLSSFPPAVTPTSLSRSPSEG